MLAGLQLAEEDPAHPAEAIGTGTPSTVDVTISEPGVVLHVVCLPPSAFNRVTRLCMEAVVSSRIFDINCSEMPLHSSSVYILHMVWHPISLPSHSPKRRRLWSCLSCSLACGGVLCGAVDSTWSGMPRTCESERTLRCIRLAVTQ